MARNTETQETFENLPETENKVIQFHPTNYQWLKDASKTTRLDISDIVNALIDNARETGLASLKEAMKRQLERQLAALDSLEL